VDLAGQGPGAAAHGYDGRVDLAEATASLIALEAALEDGTAAGDGERQRVVAGYNEDGCRPRSGGLPDPHQMVWRTPYTEPRRRAAEAARKARRPSAFSAAQARTRPTAEELRQLSGSSLNRSPLRR